MKRAFTASLMALAVSGALAQQGDGTQVSIRDNIFKPNKVEATPERMRRHQGAGGLHGQRLRHRPEECPHHRGGADGDVYVSRRDQGDVLMLSDTNGDGRADGAPVTVANRAGAHGLAIRDSKLYLVTVKEVFVADIQPDGSLGAAENADRRPARLRPASEPHHGLRSGRHAVHQRRLTCNTCNESNPENATLLRASPDGKQRTIFASRPAQH